MELNKLLLSNKSLEEKKEAIYASNSNSFANEIDEILENYDLYEDELKKILEKAIITVAEMDINIKEYYLSTLYEKYSLFSKKNQILIKKLFFYENLTKITNPTRIPHTSSDDFQFILELTETNEFIQNYKEEGYRLGHYPQILKKFISESEVNLDGIEEMVMPIESERILGTMNINNFFNRNRSYDYLLEAIHFSDEALDELFYRFKNTLYDTINIDYLISLNDSLEPNRSKEFLKRVLSASELKRYYIFF